MKLLTKTSLNFISVSVLFFLVGSIVMYFSVRNIISTNLDNNLLQQKERFLLDVQSNDFQRLSSEILIISDFSDKSFSDLFSDTVVINNSNEYILYRRLDFSLEKEGKFYRASLLHSRSASDKLIMKISIMNVGFAMIFFLIVFFVNRHSIKNALSVFYSTINKLEHFEISNSAPLNLDTAEIDEVKKLNFVFEKMSEQIRKDFKTQKEYTENVSHELQTPLAVISSKVDELMQADNMSQLQMEQLALLIETTNRLSKINQALIFLTKIDNRFYSEGVSICLNDLIKDRIAVFKESIEKKQIDIKIDLPDTSIYVYMNSTLAETMLDNILKNAIIHNEINGVLHIYMSEKTLHVSNTGNPVDFDSENIFKRFVRGRDSKVSLGIGLSVVKSICDLYGFGANYQYDKLHCISIDFD